MLYAKNALFYAVCAGRRGSPINAKQDKDGICTTYYVLWDYVLCTVQYIASMYRPKEIYTYGCCCMLYGSVLFYTYMNICIAWGRETHNAYAYA
jgi:hypothetical protein